jgi:hypothetical protein
MDIFHSLISVSISSKQCTAEFYALAYRYPFEGLMKIGIESVFGRLLDLEIFHLLPLRRCLNELEMLPDYKSDKDLLAKQEHFTVV